jgi:predicted deacylase
MPPAVDPAIHTNGVNAVSKGSVRPGSIGTAQFEPGKISRGELHVADTGQAAVSAPVAIACGVNPGPTLWVQAAVHGTEAGGVIALWRFLENVDVSRMSGAIVAVLVANPLAFVSQLKSAPQDDLNLHKAFPGNSKGTVTEQTAYHLNNAAVGVADVCLDFHSGGINWTVPFYTYYWDDGSLTARRSAELARHTSSRHICVSREPAVPGDLLSEFTRRGIPTLLVECGGGAVITSAHTSSFIAAIEGVAAAMGIFPNAIVSGEDRQIFGGYNRILAEKSGIFLPQCSPGDIREAGEVIGRVVSLHGDEIQVIRSEGRGFITALGREFLQVQPGMLLSEVNYAITA